MTVCVYCPILYRNLMYKSGQDFLDMQFVDVFSSSRRIIREHLEKKNGLKYYFKSNRNISFALESLSQLVYINIAFSLIKF